MVKLKIFHREWSAGTLTIFFFARNNYDVQKM